MPGDHRAAKLRSHKYRTATGHSRSGDIGRRSPAPPGACTDINLADCNFHLQSAK